MAYLKGAFINAGSGTIGSLRNIIVFQFNPDRVSRTPSLAQPPASPVGAGFVDARQQASGPTESYSFTLNLDASDQLAAANLVAAGTGILPALSALELLMIPTSTMDPDLSALADGGCDSYNIAPLELPTVLFFWGPYRIWPVTVNSLSVTETGYDELLNPIRAEVQVSLQVLTENQIDQAGVLAKGAFKYSQAVKQVLAALTVTDIASAGTAARFTSTLSSLQSL